MKIGIIGTGAYAIALASILEDKNYDITMWTKMEYEYKELITNHTNLKCLDYKLKDNIKFTLSLDELVQDKDYLILALPAPFVNQTMLNLKGKITNQKILIATKGIEPDNNLLIHDYLIDTLQTKKIACISGPSFAKDIIKKESLGLTLASFDRETLTSFKELFEDIPYLKLELTNDIIGCQLCGTIKNIMAIFSGILEGMKANSSTKAKFIVDASYNIQTIIELLGGEKETFYTYAGLGDLILTATSIESRNFTFGKLIGEDKDFKTYQQNTTVEGIDSLKNIKKMLDKENVYCEIVDILYKIIFEEEKKDSILTYLNQK